jgi:sporulation protein YlmC with PRC-barrel domain
MPRLRDIEGSRFAGADGVDLGAVEHVLFHPSEPRAVALMVRPDRVFGVVKRAHAVVPLAGVGIGEHTASIDEEKLPPEAQVARELGYDPETTVIWRGMAVASATGEPVGAVYDVEFSPEGRVLRVQVSTGVAGDIAHGLLEVGGDEVRGFDGSAVVIAPEPQDLRADGGLALKAGKQAAAMRAGASATAKAAGEALVDASYLTGRAIGAAAATPVGRTARSAWRGAAAAVREAMKDDEDPPR